MPFPKIKIAGYTIASTFVAIGGILNGYDTGSIGAITEMPAFLKTFGHLSPTMRGFTVSLIMLTGALPAVFAGQIADRLGRLRIIVAGALVFMIGAILQAAASKLPMFLVGRALCGIGEGLWLSNVAVYICEIAPSRRRGRFVSLPQFASAAGVCAGYFTCYGSVRIEGSMAWRLPFVIMAAMAAVMAGGCLFLPESPRWLILHGKRDQALKELDRLDFSKVEAEKDVLRPIERDTAEIGWIAGLKLIFSRENRSKTFLALFMLGIIQLSGIDAVLYYAPTLFAQAGIPSQSASFLASGVSAILMLAISIPAFFYADTWGRRTSAISGGIVLSGCMLLIGSLYAAEIVHAYGIARWVVVVSIFVFALTYCLTWNIVAKIYASEIQPAQTRATANSIATGLNFFANFFVAMLTPILLADSAYGAYFLFGLISLVSVVVLALYMPETKGLSLENIHEAFERPVFKSWAHLLRRASSRTNASDPHQRSERDGSGIQLVEQPGLSTSEAMMANGALHGTSATTRMPTTV